MNRRSLPFMVSLEACYIVASIMIQPVNAIDWVELGRWSGSSFPEPQEFDTGQFYCSHVEWRIRWSYNAVGSPFESLLLIKKDGNLLIYSSSYFSKSGVRNIHNETGYFYLSILCLNTNEYTIIVEQDVDSIPEFPSFLVLPLFMIVTLLAYRKKQLIQ